MAKNTLLAKIVARLHRSTPFPSVNSGDHTVPRALGKILGFTLLGAWVLTALLGGAFYLAPHYAAYKGDDLRNIASTDRNELSAHHFLSLQCACSKKLLKHLAERRADERLTETIHLIGEDPKVIQSLSQAGYKLDIISSEQIAMEKYNLKVLPQLLVRRGPQIAYQGGYAIDQKHTETYQDQLIFAALVKNQSIEVFPIRGCMNGFFQNQMFANFKQWL